MAKLRHCAKFRCTGIQRRIVDGIFERGEREEGRGGGLSGEKGGQKSERASHPAARTRRERKKGGEERRKKEMAPVVAEAGGTVCYTTGSGSSCRRHRKWPRNSLPCNSLLPFRCCSSVLPRLTSPPSTFPPPLSVQPSTLNYRPPSFSPPPLFLNPFVYAFPVEDSRHSALSLLWRFRYSNVSISFVIFSLFRVTSYVESQYIRLVYQLHRHILFLRSSYKIFIQQISNKCLPFKTTRHNKQH